MKYIKVLMFLITINIYSQEIKNIDFIIVIDEEITTNSLGIKFLITSKGGSREVEAVTGYYPGNISLKKSDYDDLISDETQKVILKFNYQTYIDGKSYYYRYEIEYNKLWLQDTYNILKIYNLDKRKYRKKLEPLSKDRNYTFELLSPSYTFIRARKP